jgi:hypothetical protein
MVETLERLDGASTGLTRRAIVWEHNQTPVGVRRRFTDMARARDVQKRRASWVAVSRHDLAERFCVVIVGFGTHRGPVVAGDVWGAADAPACRVPPAREGCFEDVIHASGQRDTMLLFQWPHDDGGIAGLAT